MSRFWSSNANDEEDDFFDDEEDEEEEEEEEEEEDDLGVDEEDDDLLEDKPAVSSKAAKWKIGGTGSGYDSDDDEKKAFKSEKDKRWEEIETAADALEDSLEEELPDLTDIFKAFTTLNEQIIKSKKVIKQHGVPSFYIQSLLSLEEFITEYAAASKKKAKAINRLKQAATKNAVQYEKFIEMAREGTLTPESTKPENSISALESNAKDEKKEVVSRESIQQELGVIIAKRGKKGYNKPEHIKQLKKLLEKSRSIKTVDQEVLLIFHIINARFDSAISTQFMSHKHWGQAYDNICKMLSLITEHNIELEESGEAGLIDTIKVAPDQLDINTISFVMSGVQAEKDDEKSEPKKEVTNAPAKRVVKLPGSLMAFCSRFDEEFTKSLQSITDSRTDDFLSKLRGEKLVLDLSEKITQFYTSRKEFNNVAKAVIISMSHLYYKVDVKNTNTQEKLNLLATTIYAHGDEKLKARAMLYTIYHHALHYRFYEARDLMLMSHLQDTIHHADIPTQVLFNRTMARLGVCAFVNGLIKEAHQCLVDIYSSQRMKELLAQGISMRTSDKTAEQEKKEKARQVPFHKQINLDLLESVYLICAMLLEVPHAAAHAFDVKRKTISRSFRRLLDYYENRQLFSSPPENTRETVVAAARALMQGDWSTTNDYVQNMKCWKYLYKSEAVFTMLEAKIKQEALRTYLFTYSAHYDSFSLTELSSMFSLPANSVHSILSKMMINDELIASWDQPTSAIVMHRVEPTRLQALALQFAEKASIFVESNERLLDARTGSYGYSNKSKWQDSNRNRRNYRNQRNYNK